MLWAISVILIVLWMVGLSVDEGMDSYIHVLYAAAVALLVVSLSQEVMLDRKLRNVLRNHVRKT